MFNSGANLEKKRDEIIMACLNGGQHIDAALEAADKLVPQFKIDEAWAKDKELADGYNKRMEELWAARKVDYSEGLSESEKIQPWYASVISRWWPF